MGLAQLGARRGYAIVGERRNLVNILAPVNRSASTVATLDGGSVGRPGLDGGPAHATPTFFYPMLGETGVHYGKTGNLPGAPQLLLVPIPISGGRPNPAMGSRNVANGLRFTPPANSNTSGRTLTPPINQSGR